MAVKMLACMSSKTLEEAIEVEWESAVKTPEPRSESKHDRLRIKTRSFTGCHTLIHPSWSFKSLGHQSASPPHAASPGGEGADELAWGRHAGRGWKRFFAALQCSTAPLRSVDVRSQFKGMAAKLTGGACIHSCGRPCSAPSSEQNNPNAVRPEASLASEDAYDEASFPPPVVENPSHSKDEQGSKLGDVGACCARSSQAATPERRMNGPSKPSTPRSESPSYASYHMANGAAVKVTEELRNFNRVVPPGAGVPGTEWFSQVELGVFITFVTLSNGGNALKRIRFSRDIFSKSEAEVWWAENGNRVRAVYNVPAFERSSTNQHQPTSSSEEEVSGVSGYATPAYSPQGSRGPSPSNSIPAGYGSGISRGASWRGTSSREVPSRDAAIREAAMREAAMRDAAMRESMREATRDEVSEASDSATNDRATETETIPSEEGSDRNFDGEGTAWVEEDVPGVYLTLKNLSGGGRELKRVRFSREKFTEKQAKIWWDENRGRIHKQYL